MKKFNINNFVKKVIEESLQEKADELVGKIKSKVDEWTPNAPVEINAQPDDIAEEDGFDTMDDYDMEIESRLCDEDSEEFDEERCRYNKKAKMGDEIEMDEELIGGQKKLDKNKNGKLDREDFKMLRKDRSEGKEMCSECGYGRMEEGICNECGYGRMEEDMDEEMEEGNAFTGALAKAKESGDNDFEVGDKKFHVKGATHKKKSVKESFQLSESEMISLIEKIVLEQKKAKGTVETEKVQKASKKENEDAIKAVTKKMKEYLKNMSVDEYSTNPEDFPMSNHQMNKKNDTMSYHPSDAVDEYIDAFAHPGMTNLTFDEIKPDDKKIKKHIEGDSTTGNAVKDKKGKALGNVVPTKTGEKFMNNFEENLYGAEQKEASYKRQPQPVDVAGTEKIKGSLKKLRSNSKKAQDVLDKVDESTTKKEKVINEEFERIQLLMNYNKITQ